MGDLYKYIPEIEGPEKSDADRIVEYQKLNIDKLIKANSNLRAENEILKAKVEMLEEQIGRLSGKAGE